MFALVFSASWLYAVYRSLKFIFLKFNIEQELAPEKIKHCILWGAIAAPLLSCLIGFSFAKELASSLNNQTQKIIAENVLLGPFYEEFFKGLAPISAYFIIGAISARSYVLISILSGLGFFFTETFIAIISEVINGTNSKLAYQLIMRGMVLSLLHPACTCLTGLGVGYSIKTRNYLYKILFLFSGFIGAYFMHFWNNGVAVSINLGEKIDQSEFLLIHIIVISIALFLTRVKSDENKI